MDTRTRLDLDGIWQFTHATEVAETPPAAAAWRDAHVPGPWQAQFDDLRLADGVGWYRRTIRVDSVDDRAAILHFGAVDYHATVWVNGRLAGEHEGGYLPFEFEISALLTAGDNQILVRAIDPDDDRARFADAPFSEIPHGKQSWYGPIGGIWQSVWLEFRPHGHITSLRLTPDVASGRIAAAAAIAGIEDENQTEIDLRVLDAGGQRVGHTRIAGVSGNVALDKEPELWSPDSPALYTVDATLLIDGEPVDQLCATCGFRTVQARDGRIYLNGEPIYLRGVLDQGYYPETIYTPPSLDFLEDQAQKAKALGLNCLRIHIKIEDPRYYEVADRLGLLVWTEIPNWAVLSDATNDRAKATFQAMVARDWNHPSIIAWTLINENWGTDLARNPEHRQWLADFVDEARRLDPTRLIVDNSACGGNLHVAGDLEDYHHYRAIPDHAADWDAWVADFASRPRWAWADDFDHTRRPDLPLLVSEFGNWGLPDPAGILEQGREPWWAETGHDWGQGIVYPHGMAQRFAAAGLDTVFGTLADFTRRHQIHMARSLNYEIATMRLQPEIGGYVITEFTDVHWECNGLMDMQRRVKAGLEPHFVPLNQDNVVVIRPHQWSSAPGGMVPVTLQSMGVDGPGEEGVIAWQCGAQRGEVAAPGSVVEIALPAAPGMHELTAAWQIGNSVVARNRVDLAVVAPPTPTVTVHVADDPALASALSELGYRVNADPAQADLLLARTYTEKIQHTVQQGVRLLLLPAGAEGEAGVPLPFGHIVSRDGTQWQGDWATSFAWLRKEGPFAHLPGEPLLEMEYAGIMPDEVLVGIPAWASHASWAGLALGWIHWTTSLVTSGPYGRGRFTVSTFKLSAHAVADDPMAAALMAGLVHLAAEREH